MKFSLVALFAVLVLDGAANAAGPDFIICKSTYALCTTAPCSPIPGSPGMVSCKCGVLTGYSVGSKECEEKNTPEGLQLRSRYYPIKSYARCSNSRPWAWCLDSPCIADKTDSAQAACKCSVVSDKGAYVIVNNAGKYDKSSCTTGMYSSASVIDSNQLIDYLRTHKTKVPAPAHIKVYKE